MPIVLTEAAVKRFDFTPKEFRWERYYAPGGSGKWWQAVTPFEINIELDKNLDPTRLVDIEYRQYIRGACWVALGDEDYPDDPNANDVFKIPKYAGQNKVVALPTEPVNVEGLTWKWKEDGEKEGTKIERFGYRATATMDEPREADLWHPRNTVVSYKYLLRDTPSLRGNWNINQKDIWIWMQLDFRGCVVEVEPHGDTTRPIKILKEKSWKCHWFNGHLEIYTAATEIDAP